MAVKLLPFSAPLRLRRVDDLGAAVKRLVGAGARMLSPAARREWGDEAAYFTDPDGNVIAVARVATE